MKRLLSAVLALALCAPTTALAQSGATPNNGNYAPLSAVCVRQTDATCTAVSATNPLPVTGGGGGGGGGSTTGTATAAPPTYTEGATTAPLSFNLTGDLRGIVKQSGTWNVGLTGTLPAFTVTPTFNIGTAPTLTVNATLQAAENHVGEVGSNQITITNALTVTASSAYTSGNAVGGLMTLANASRVSGSSGSPGTSGLVQSTTISVKSAQTGAADLIIFGGNPTASTCTDKTAFAVAAADFDKIVGVMHVTDWTSLGTPSVGQAQQQAMPFDVTTATLYACLVTRSTPTFAATTDVTVRVRILRN